MGTACVIGSDDDDGDGFDVDGNPCISLEAAGGGGGTPINTGGTKKPADSGKVDLSSFFDMFGFKGDKPMTPALAIDPKTGKPYATGPSMLGIVGIAAAALVVVALMRR
jgi:hypothetical protein